MTERTIGIDISKLHLDAYRMEDRDGEAFRELPARASGAVQMARHDPGGEDRVRADGSVSSGLREALSGKFPLVKVNPLQARRFAEACGTRAKTDAVDARTLARMGAALAFEPDEPVSEKLLELERLADCSHSFGLRGAPACETAAMFKAMPF